ncbi:hypothetical protein [Mycobacterium sp. HUMS_1102779]
MLMPAAARWMHGTRRTRPSDFVHHWPGAAPQCVQVISKAPVSL